MHIHLSIQSFKERKNKQEKQRSMKTCRLCAFVHVYRKKRYFDSLRYRGLLNKNWWALKKYVHEIVKIIVIVAADSASKREWGRSNQYLTLYSLLLCGVRAHSMSQRSLEKCVLPL
jgi:ribosomal protein S18